MDLRLHFRMLGQKKASNECSLPQAPWRKKNRHKPSFLDIYISLLSEILESMEGEKTCEFCVWSQNLKFHHMYLEGLQYQCVVVFWN